MLKSQHYYLKQVKLCCSPKSQQGSSQDSPQPKEVGFGQLRPMISSNVIERLLQRLPCPVNVKESAMRSDTYDLYCSPESQRGSPVDGPQATEGEGGLAALHQLASPDSSRPASRSRSRGTAGAQLADVESSSWDTKEQRSSKFRGIGADLDFQKFLQRQRKFLEVGIFSARLRLNLWSLRTTNYRTSCNSCSGNGIFLRCTTSSTRL